MTDTHTIGTNSSTKASEIAHPPVDPIAELGEWHRRLSTIAQAPLEFCPDFPLLARRHEAWWTRSLDRPLILDIGPKQAGHEITRRLELLENPRQWLAAKQEDLEATCFAGDALPSIRVDFGPVMLGGLLGGRVEFQSDTTWTHAFIDDDWSNLPDWSIREDLPWWNLPRQLTALTVANARGRYLLKTPDLGGSADVLLNFRGATSLCMDVLERPEEMLSAINAIYPPGARLSASCIASPPRLARAWFTGWDSGRPSPI